MEAKEKFIKYNFKGWNVNRHTENLSDLYTSWCYQHSVGLESLPRKASFMDAETLLAKGSDRYDEPLTDEQIKFLKGFIELFYQVQEWGVNNEG